MHADAAGADADLQDGPPGAAGQRLIERQVPTQQRHAPVHRIVAADMQCRAVIEVPRRSGRGHKGSRRGSNASRTASPMKISSVSTPPRTTNAVRPSQGACRLFLAWATSSPSDGDPGGRPKPRKSSVDNNVTDPDRMNGR